MSTIETADLRKSFGDHVAVDGLSLSVDAGECYGLLGPNGAGKTTAIELLTGQLEPDAGSATVLGRDPAAEPIAVREHVGILPEKESPPSFLTPREFFQFVGRVRGLAPEGRRDRVAEWSDRLGLAEDLDTLSADLSRGNQQKVMFAAAFLHEPEAVFIDEPLANLDPIVQERVKEALTTYATDHAVLLSTHHVEVAAEVCTRVGIVRDGTLVAERDPAALGPDRSLLDEFVDAVASEHGAARADGSGSAAGGSGSAAGGNGSAAGGGGGGTGSGEHSGASEDATAESDESGGREG